MIQVIFISQDINKAFKVRSVVSKIDFHVGKRISFMHYNPAYDGGRILQNEDNVKIYIVDLDKYYYNIVGDIRKDDWFSPIIFIASNKETLDQYYSLSYSIFSYIALNDNFDKKLVKDLTNIVNNRFDKGIFNFNNRNNNLSIYYKQILYIYRDTQKRKTVVVTNNNKYILNMYLKDITKYLDNRFRKCHRACILNKKRVENYNWNNGSFVLDNGEQIDLLSKNYIDEVNRN